jgi:hypothetical protein
MAQERTCSWRFVGAKGSFRFGCHHGRDDLRFLVLVRLTDTDLCPPPLGEAGRVGFGAPSAGAAGSEMFADLLASNGHSSVSGGYLVFGVQVFGCSGRNAFLNTQTPEHLL